MASGDTLAQWDAWDATSPTTNYATRDTRNNHRVMDFDAATDETLYFEVVLDRKYSGGGVTITLVWMASSATSGSCRWATAFERHQDETDDLDSNSFATANTTGGTAPSTSGAAQYTTIAHTTGAQMDSLAVGESFRLSVARDADGTSGTDDMTGDAELLRVEIRET